MITGALAGTGESACGPRASTGCRQVVQHLEREDDVVVAGQCRIRHVGDDESHPVGHAGGLRVLACGLDGRRVDVERVDLEFGYPAARAIAAQPSPHPNSATLPPDPESRARRGSAAATPGPVGP